ncbi:MAG: hypothetical protein Q4C21_06640 [Oscillospiraceae bacterium]|nr:hypothetical protein [Oscillospiraceae bacterium]
MNIEKTEIFQGNKIEISEMILKQAGSRLVLLCKIHFENKAFQMTFYNVSRFRIGEVSMPLEIHGFEIIDRSQNGWEKDSAYEIRDFENDYIHFYCESFKIE